MLPSLLFRYYQKCYLNVINQLLKHYFESTARNATLMNIQLLLLKGNFNPIFYFHRNDMQTTPLIPLEKQMQFAVPILLKRPTLLVVRSNDFSPPFPIVERRRCSRRSRRGPFNSIDLHRVPEVSSPRCGTAR